MKLTYRDKVILIGLAVIAVWAIGIMYFIRPKFNDLDTANKDYDQVVVTRDKKAAEVEADKNLKEEVNAAFDEVQNIAGNFYRTKKSHEVSELVDNMLDEFNIVNTDLMISSYSSVTLAYITADSQPSQTEFDKLANPDPVVDETAITEAEAAPIDVPAYSLAFGFNCKFEDLQNFVDSLPTRSEKSLVVTTCTIEDVKEEVVTGNMTMVFMMMPELTNPLDASSDNAAE